MNEFVKLISKLFSYIYRKKNILKEFKGSETNEIWPRVKTYLVEELKKANVL